MADTTDAPQPMTDRDDGASLTPYPETPLKGARTDTGTSADGSPENGKLTDAKQSLKDGTAKLRDQAGDKARTLVEDGKARATGALEQLSQMLTEAAGNVDEKLGANYGQYARTAAERVQGFSSSLDEKSVDELVDTAREFVRKSPGVAIGAAAALGFVVARLLTAGLDQRDKA